MKTSSEKEKKLDTALSKLTNLNLNANLKENLQHLSYQKNQLEIEKKEISNKYIDLPVGVGFGIKDAETAKKISETADAVIVGSTIVSIVEQLSSDRDKMVTKVGNLALQISNAIN